MHRHVRAPPIEQRPGHHRAMLGHEDVFEDEVLRPGAAKAEREPGVIHNDILLRQHEVDAARRALQLLKRADQQPMPMIDAACELPAPVHDPATVHGTSLSL